MKDKKEVQVRQGGIHFQETVPALGIEHSYLGTQVPFIVRDSWTETERDRYVEIYLKIDRQIENEKEDG